MTQTLDTNDIPQADLLWDVARVTEAVHGGAVTPAAIAAYLGNKVPRQGLYYARAAYSLGLVAKDANTGEIALTTYGRAFMRYDRTSQRQALRRLVQEREPMRSVIAALKSNNGLTREGIARTIQQLAPLSTSTALRRAQTVAAWLCAVGIASWREGRLYYVSPQLGASTFRNN